jgi:hypothetical protein
MRAAVLTELLQRQPCPLIRLHLSNGAVFDIRDPDLVVIRRSTVDLLLPPDGPSQREAVINLLHIIWVDIITTPT